MILTIDFETRSSYRWPEVANNLRQFGAYEYAKHAEVLMLAVMVDDEEPRLWSPFIPGGLADSELVHLVNSADEIHGHNIQFERCIWRGQMAPLGFPDLPLEKCYCTAALAASYALPRSLDGAGRALGLPVEKDKAGHSLMLKMCKPRRPKKHEDPNGIYWHEEPEQLERLAKYCLQDVKAERAIEKALPRRETPTERLVWLLDQRVNDRGLHIDRAFCEAAVRETTAYTAYLMKRLKAATAGELATISASSPAPLRYLASRGVELPDFTSATVDAALAAGVEDDAARVVLEIRQSLGKSSVSKYQTMIDAAGDDDRVRGTLLYCGANTGRWSGKLIQPQNFPRGSLKLHQVEEAIQDFQSTGWEWLSIDPMHAASSCLRGAICAAPGNVLYCADFSNIEGRLQAWLSGEAWKVEAFQAYDAGEGPDLYKKCYADLFQVPVEAVDKNQRQMGKTLELSSGYAGGVAALVKGCATNRLKPEQLAAATMEMMNDPEEKERSEWIAGKWLEKHPGELPLEVATALDVIKSRWRGKHPAIVNAWRGVEEACILTVETGKVHEFLGLRFGLRAGFLLVKLPSGRYIAFYEPRVVEGDFSKRQMTFMHENSLTRKWCRKRTYGGDMFQSIIQAIARDIMAESMLRIEAAGYPVIGTVHDEVISEAPKGFGSLENFEATMAGVPAWAPGFPNAVEGWVGKRYRKG